MSRFFGLQIDPGAQSAFQHDYWEEFTKVNEGWSHEPDIEVVRVSNNSNKSKNGEKRKNKDRKENDNSSSEGRGQRFKRYIREKADTAKGLVLRSTPGTKAEVSETELNETSQENSAFNKPLNLHPSIYPELPQDHGLVENGNNAGVREPKASFGKDQEAPDLRDLDDDEEEEKERFISVAVQTEMSYLRDVEDLPYSCCFCCRSSTPCIVWVFVAISLIFFKIGALVTGRWVYLSQTNFDEIVFYIAFTVCLAFATFYFRHGTKYHNPFSLLFLVLTVPIMWGLLAFTTFFVKKDIFFYIGSVVYTVFSIPYIFIGTYIAYRFWTSGKLFLRRVEGDRAIESACRKLFFASSLMIFDGQLSICSSIISMSSAVNQESTHVWISSLIFGPISIFLTVLWVIVGWFAMRSENRLLTWIFTVLSVNQFILIIGMLLKRPGAPGGKFLFVNVAMVFSSTIVLSIHICLLVVVWNWIVPNYGKGLKSALQRTSQNNCIQCAQLTICR